MDTGLKGKTALITGGGTGIGKAITLALADEGVHIAIASNHPAPETLAAIESRGVQAHFIPTDVSQELQVVQMVQQTIDHFGHLDLFINNAAGTWHEPVSKITTDAWTKTINTNLLAAVWACREVARHMTARGTGNILIVGSTAQFDRGVGEATYHISKTGLNVLMKSLAIELAPYGIRVNLLVPGHYPTQLTAGLDDVRAERMRRIIPLRRFGRVEECAPAAILLLSDKLSSYTTGSEFVVDGGVHLRPIQLMTDEELYALNAPE